jgi:bromodomain and WD repeat domain-containing protein 1/3
MYLFFRDTTDHDVTTLYHELADAYHSSDSEVDIEDINKPSTSSQRPTRAVANRHATTQNVNKDWKVACRQLLDTLWQCEDSIPFR